MKKSVSKSVSKRMTKRRTQKAGAVLPSEYFGKASKAYVTETNKGVCPSAYGKTVAQSFGSSFSKNMVGPNMFAHPKPSGMQTGGGGCSGKKKRKKSKKLRVAMKKKKYSKKTLRRKRKRR